MARHASRIFPWLVAAVAATVAATPFAAAAADPAGVRGVVLDTTCYGPCAIDDTPEPYRGDNARIAVRKPADPEFRRGAPVQDGRFRLRLAPGVYRVTAYVPDQCWDGTTRQVRVARGEFKRLELAVFNACIL